MPSISLSALRRFATLAAAAAALVLPARAATYYLTDGVTSVDLDPNVLAEAGLSGPVGFDVPVLATDFSFSTDDYSVSGLILHSGALTYFDSEANTYTIGNLLIGYEASRSGAGRSGLYVADLLGGYGVLFDIGFFNTPWINGSLLLAGPASLYVAPELAGFFDTSFAGRLAGEISFAGSVRQASAVPDESTYGVAALMLGVFVVAGRIRNRLAPRSAVAAA